jgi:lysophospholipase L1-like esterase
MIKPVLTSVLSPVILGITQLRRKPVVPLDSFDYILLVGSSSTYETFSISPIDGRQENKTRARLIAGGIDVPMLSRAVGGATVTDLDANINTYMTEMKLTDKTLGVIINIGSNDINAQLFDSVPLATRDAMEAGIRSIAAKIIAAGHTPILATVHTRSGFGAVYEEWADRMYRPLIREISPNYIIGELATFDYSKFYIENELIPNWWRDGVHPGLPALTPIKDYTITGMKSRFIYSAPVQEEAVIVSITSPSLSGNRCQGINDVIGAATGSITGLYTTHGALLAGAVFSWSGANGGFSSSKVTPGRWNAALEATEVQRSGIFTSTGGTATITANFGAGFASRAGTITFTASNVTASRSSRYTVTGGGFVDFDAGAAGVQVASLPFTLNASGVMTFTYTSLTAFSGYLSGVKFTFN